jgi:tetratricopeptide (TPR) repeat protein
VLEGNVRKEGNELRISAQLIDAERGFHIWTKSFETTLEHIFDVQDAISRGIVAELKPRLLPGGQVADRTPPTEIMPAYELLLRGRYHMRRREESSIRRSIELFREAIELDPAFGEAYRELARAYVLLPAYSYEDENEMYDLAIATVERGAAADGKLAHDVLALVHFNRWEWVEAELAFRDALAASPSDPSVHQWYSQHLASVGNTAGSLQQVLEARRLDLLSPVVNDRLAICGGVTAAGASST